MKFGKFFLVCICLLLVIDDISAGKYSSGGFGRGSSRGSSRGTSYTPHRESSFSRGTSRFPSQPAPKPSSGNGRIYATSNTRGTAQHDKHVNTQLIHAEGGGATRPTQVKPPQSPPYPTNLHPIVPASVPSNGGKPKVVTENKQFSPSAPSQDHVMKSSAGSLQNQGPPSSGQGNPSWSSPYFNNNNKPISPAQTNGHPSYPLHPSPTQTHPNLGTNPAIPNQSNPAWSNPHLANKPSVPNSQPIAPGQIGFKPHVYPQSNSASTQFSPSASGNPPYPVFAPHPVPSSGRQFAPVSHPPYPTNPMPAGSAWSSHPSMASPHHQTSSMPLGNPYSMHPPAYGAPAGVPSGSMPYGQHYYPQQIAQPAAQPFVPGQTILMVPGQQSSGPGFGQLVKEALVFSTINAGVNRLINPHTHYIESRPAETHSVPTSTTHITYNNHYFNTGPNANGTMSPMPQGTGAVAPNIPQGTGAVAPNVPQGTGAVAPNVPQGTGPTINQNGAYIPNAGNSNVPSGSVTSNVANSGTPSLNSGVVTAGSNVMNDQNNSLNNNGNVDNTFSYRISDEELYKISEELFAKNSKNLTNYIKLNLQTCVTSPNVTDEAKESLFDISPELLEYPTISVMQPLYDSYGHDFREKLSRTLETRKQENLFMDTFLNTNEMSTAMQWLADHQFINPDDFERKDVLRRIWFTIFSGSSCGFERVFASENYGTAIVGVQDWIYFAKQESLKRINYMGCVDKLNLGSTASLLKLNFEMDGIVRPNATIFVGTLPELEMSLYTICFHARPNNICPVSLGGIKFNIYTHSFTYFGYEVLDLGLPMF